MRWFIISILFVLACGPLRKRFFSNWRFTIPALIGGVCAWFLFNSVFTFACPWWAVPAAVLIAALGIGINAKLPFDEIFRRRE